MSKNYNSTLQSNNADLQAILDAINELPEATEQATPTISVSDNGLITAIAGDKSSTYQMAFQPAQTITPGTSNKTIAANTYLGGVQTIKGDANLVASNIVSGKSIFGVVGTGGSGGDTTIEDGFIDGSLAANLENYTNSTVTSIKSSAFSSFPKLTTVNFTAVTTIGHHAFESCSKLTTISFPNCTTIGSNAFNSCAKLTTISFPNCTTLSYFVFAFCTSLTTADFPKCTTIGSNVFKNCSKLTTASFPIITSIDNSAFYSCTSLTTADFPKCTTIGSGTFEKCYNLKSLYLTGSSLCKLSGSNAFSSTPIGGYSTTAGTYGSIYVPASLLTSYQTAANWSYFSSRFVGI